jgi:hypothetical protein
LHCRLLSAPDGTDIESLERDGQGECVGCRVSAERRQRRGADQDAAVPLTERARGAERVVVGRVASVTPVWRVTDFGDRLIVSVVRVAVDQTLKGQAEGALDVEVEGGTIGDLTLNVSDLETFVPGERAVFYLRRSVRGAMVPHLRGQGLLKLDRFNRVAGSSLTLDEIRRSVAAANPR